MIPSPFGPILKARGLVVLDGGLATALEEQGYVLADELWSAKLLCDHPEAISMAHRRYLTAGADCITTASYQASYVGFAASGIDHAESASLLMRSTELARKAIDQQEFPGVPSQLVAASVGPYAAFLADGSEYKGRYEADRGDLEAFHQDRWAALADSNPDIMACETIPNGMEAEVLLDILEADRGRWAWLSFCCGDDGHLWDGTPIEDVAALCDRASRVAAVGVNCTAPRLVPRLVEKIRSTTDLPIIAYPNSGETYDAITRSWWGTDEPWMTAIKASIKAGASVIGGCCRIGPDRIRELREWVDSQEWRAR